MSASAVVRGITCRDKLLERLIKLSFNANISK